VQKPISLIGKLKEDASRRPQLPVGRENIQQYQIILRRPAFLKSVYRVGMVGYMLCAGRLTAPRMVPP
jgi:hypothetical protein